MTYAKFYKGREELQAGGLGNLFTASDTRQIDKGRLDDTRLALRSLDNALSES